MSNLVENLFDSIAEITKSYTAQVSFDKTIICSITQRYEEPNNMYRVNNGQVSFDAYADGDTAYTTGQQVYVTIPEGNYSNKKLIIRAFDSDEEVDKRDYIPAEKRIMRECVAKIGSLKAKTAVAQSMTFTPTRSKLDTISYVSIGFDPSGLSGEVSEGEYAILVKIGEKEFLIKSSDFEGNPYWLQGELSHQEFIYSWSSDQESFNIEVNLSIDDSLAEKDCAITLDNFRVAFGYNTCEDTVYLDNDSESLTYNADTEKVLLSLNFVNDKALYNENSLSYAPLTRVYTAEEREKEIKDTSLSIDEMEDKAKELPAAGDIVSKYTVYWLYYQEGWKGTEDNHLSSKITGNEYWKTMKMSAADATGAYTYTATIDHQYNSQKYKIVILDEEENAQTSNTLTFTNADPVKQKTAVSDTITLTVSDKGHLGVYNLYGLDNKLVSAGFTISSYSITVDMADGSEWGSSPHFVVWTLPAVSTMLAPPKEVSEYFKKNPEEKEYKTEEGVWAKGAYNYTYSSSTQTFSYIIKDSYSPAWTNNAVSCLVDDVYSNLVSFSFGQYGTNGTNYSLNIVANAPAINAALDAYLEVEAVLEGDDGVIALDEAGEIEWSWYTETEGMFELQDGASDSKKKIRSLSGSMDDMCYSILQCTLKNFVYNNVKINLTAYLPIARRRNSTILGIDGVTRVVYDRLGANTTQSKDPYKAYWTSGEEISDITPYLFCQEANCPFELEEKVLIPPDLKPTNLKVITVDLNGYWQQPILITSNVYTSNLLNSWNGEMKIDEENNIIMSSILGAGRKNADNTFTGVLLGTVNEEGETSVYKTGLYGFNKGERKFSFDEDGNAFIGCKSDGKSTYFNLNTNDGTIEIQSKGFMLDEYGNAKFEGKITATEGTIGGWTIGKNELKSNKAAFILENKTKNETNYNKNWLTISPNQSFYQVCAIGTDSLGLYHHNEEKTAGWVYSPSSVIFNGIAGTSELGAETEGGSPQRKNYSFIGTLLTTSGFTPAFNAAEYYDTGFLLQNINGNYIVQNKHQYDTNNYMFIENSAYRENIFDSDKINLTMSQGLYLSQKVSKYQEARNLNDILEGYNVEVISTVELLSQIHRGSSPAGLSINTIYQSFLNANKTKLNTGSTTSNCYLLGSWSNTTAIATDSDASLKHEIAALPEAYSTLFDNLSPVVFKYNNGTSDRLHTGFIAQEVETALEKANIDSQNFAGYVKDYDGTRRLRYEEFIALNTSEIQKLKARIKDLEEKEK